ncbi:uncharacterized protein BDV17DRAFT_293556 [Aspergillus undulatus]|uniref:uncharacterized protein n=1 Tax=Aspergillus undulatus TaxID=1810928 RepID=UPI003CCDA8EE
MARYKLFAALLVGSLLTVNWRVSNTRTLTTHNPELAGRGEILRVLHDHERFIQLSPVGTSLANVPTTPESYADDWFQTPETLYPIKTYSFGEAITVIPGIGSLGVKHIQFETLLRNTESGVKTKRMTLLWGSPSQATGPSPKVTMAMLKVKVQRPVYIGYNA